MYVSIIAHVVEVKWNAPMFKLACQRHENVASMNFRINRHELIPDTAFEAKTWGNPQAAFSPKISRSFNSPLIARGPSTGADA